MNKLLSPGGITVALLLIASVIAWTGYNRLIGLQEGVDAAWSQVENVYQRRTDLIPNLVKTVQGARDFEQETLQNIVDARAGVGETHIQGAPDAQQLEGFKASQSALSNALSRLLVVVERYPELKTTEAFRDLQRQLEGAENRIAVERRRYNEAAKAFNTSRRRFPSNLIADYFGFNEKPYFKADEGTAKPPQVDFSG
jgi:LemA protein